VKNMKKYNGLKKINFLVKDIFRTSSLGVSLRERKLKKMQEERLKKELLKKKKN